MKNLLTRDMKHLLWKNECGDDFLILKHMEIYRQSESEIGIYCWKRAVSLRMQKLGLISRVMDSDDQFDILFAKIESLPQIMQQGGLFRRRPVISGKWIRRKEAILGHRIIPFNPELPKNISQRVIGLKMPKGVSQVVSAEQ